jgi:hypothetical protein
VTDDDDLDRLALERHRQTYHELRAEEQAMKELHDKRMSDQQRAEFQQRMRGCRVVLLGLVLFWAFVVLAIYSCNANAAGRLVFLEDEQDLGNGFKLCIYTEGVTITVPSYRLCPLSIEV